MLAIIRKETNKEETVQTAPEEETEALKRSWKNGMKKD
jgi:hypothetical protein